MLTVLGYSISDTIVVMDRIRFNLKQKINNKLNFSVIVNNSINDVFTRSILTSFTILIVLTAMFFAGPISIKGFVLAMIYGTIFGTYSSIALAAPLLYDINSKRK
jgi:preprotein translocase SecF subunit